MLEKQNVEFKQVWKDEYLKWICGMANSDGGTIYLGFNDKGQVIGIDKPETLLKEIPNKIKNTLGIIAEVKIIPENGLQYITITVEKYPIPISYHGKFYIRSSSNNHEVTGPELDRIILNQLGRTWDSIPIPNVTVDDLDQSAIKKFRQYALNSGRLTAKQLDVDDKTLLKNLRLYDGKNLTIAAILLFHEDPENWVTGAYIKIGYFDKNDADLKYQDELHGSLISQVDRVVELVYTKYLKALIQYKNLQRQECYMFPKEAFREIIYNSINHKDYSTFIPIQISVYENRMYIWNSGKLPQQITKESLLQKHASLPYNPKIADTFFKAGFIEAWGRGFEKIKDECKHSKTPMPEIDINNEGIMIRCVPSKQYIKLLSESSENSPINNPINNPINDPLNDPLNNPLNDPLNDPLNISDNRFNFLTDNEKLVLKLLLKKPCVTQNELTKELNLALKTIKRAMMSLKDNGIIERRGSKKKGYWIIK